MQCYLDTPIKTKKALKEMVSAGRKVGVWGYANPFETAVPRDGNHTLVGPEPYVRKWYAQIKTVDGFITSVK